MGRFWLLAPLLFSCAALAAQPSSNSNRGTQDHEHRSLEGSGAATRKGDTLIIRLANGKSKRYKDNLQFIHGTLVRYRYRGYLREIGAHRIDVERIGTETILLSAQTGREVNSGGVYSISRDGKKIFSSDCRETYCYYNVIAWPSGKEEYIKKQSRETGVASEKDPELFSPVVRATIRWHSEREISFEAVCAFRNGETQRGKVRLQYQHKTWQPKQDKSCS